MLPCTRTPNPQLFQSRAGRARVTHGRVGRNRDADCRQPTVFSDWGRAVPLLSCANSQTQAPSPQARLESAPARVAPCRGASQARLSLLWRDPPGVYTRHSPARVEPVSQRLSARSVVWVCLPSSRFSDDRTLPHALIGTQISSPPKPVRPSNSSPYRSSTGASVAR